jgi:hypothetical protein
MAQQTFNFLQSVSEFVKAEIRKSSIGTTPRIGVIDPDYNPAEYPNVLPRVTFEGEETMSEKEYTVVAGYHPFPGDRVLMTPVNGSFVITHCLDPNSKGYYAGLTLSAPDVETLNPGSEDTTSTAFTNLTTYGPVCTVETGTRALVLLTARTSATNASTRAVMGYEVSGASTISPGVSKSLRMRGTAGGISDFERCSAAIIEEGLTPGRNIFTAKYAMEGSATARFDARTLIVWPL